jgi:hypothetical protein
MKLLKFIVFMLIMSIPVYIYWEFSNLPENKRKYINENDTPEVDIESYINWDGYMVSPIHVLYCRTVTAVPLNNAEIDSIILCRKGDIEESYRVIEHSKTVINKLQNMKKLEVDSIKVIIVYENDSL